MGQGRRHGCRHAYAAGSRVRVPAVSHRALPAHPLPQDLERPPGAVIFRVQGFEERQRMLGTSGCPMC
jgi:hypothetical protein